jgi:hypothetical protein
VTDWKVSLGKAKTRVQLVIYSAERPSERYMSTRMRSQY